jgi:cardiolipin synthase
VTEAIAGRLLTGGVYSKHPTVLAANAPKSRQPLRITPRPYHTPRRTLSAAARSVPRGALRPRPLAGTPFFLSLADWLSLVRIPLGALFLFVAGRLPLALAVLVVAGISDVLDGWAARRYRRPGDHERHRGDWLDPFCDKIFVAAVLTGIYLAHHPPPALLLMVVVRELLQGISLIIYRLVPALRRGTPYDYRAHVLGKATTVAQFTTAAALLLEHPLARPLAVASGLLGLAAVLVYVNRARVLRATP